MNKPSDLTYRSYDLITNHSYYFNIEDDKRPIFTPIMYVNQENSCFLQYMQSFYSKGHSTFVDLIRGFTSTGYCQLEKYKIRNKWFLCGKGTIFTLKIDETTVETIKPLILFCFDENTNWDNKKKYKIVINNEEWLNIENKPLVSKLSKIVKNYIENHESDVLYTNDITKYCFNSYERVKFKSIKEQAEFLNKLVEQTN